MASFKWNEELIKNSSLDEHVKNIISNEKNGIIDDSSFSRLYDLSSYNKFLTQYVKQIAELRVFYPELTEFIDKLECSVLSKVTFVNLNLSKPISQDDLVTSVACMLEELNDYDIKEEFYSFINSDKELLNIQESTETNQKYRDYGARCITPPNSKDTYISMYTSNTLHDYTSLAHEVGHAIEHRLYLNERSPLIKTILSEVSSYYFQLLMTNFLGKTIPYSEDLLLLDDLFFMDNKIVANKMSSYMFKKQRIKQKDLIRIYRENARDKALIDPNHEIKVESYRSTVKYLTSYMIATKLFLETINNKEAGIEHYKDMIIDPEEDIVKYMNKNNINIIEDNSSYDYIKVKSLNTYNKVIKK